MEKIIPSDEPARLLSAIVEEMNLEKLMATYSREGRIEYSPRLLLKVTLYGYMRRMYSVRAIERGCQENINFIYLLEGEEPPSRSTIARFRKYHLQPEVVEDLLEQMVELLMAHGEISFEESSVFIDGTKIEANANKYQFVFKKRTSRNQEKMEEKIRKELPGILELAEVAMDLPEEISIRWLKKVRKQLYQRKAKERIEFVYGRGRRKTPIQRGIEQVNGWLKREKRYNQEIHICGERNNYCKTDHDATFMHMKEDHMRNGQLKPGYNVNAATVSEYVVGNYISSDRTDTKTLIPFMEKLKDYPVERVVVDAGYESEENYSYFEEYEQLSLFVKPSNYEQKKKRKYQTDIGRRENMPYDAETDSYTCAQGKTLAAIGTRKTKSSAGYPIETTVYECADCSGCPCKEKCIRKGTSKVSLEERTKRLNVSKKFQAQREAMEAKITTEEGTLLRVNRSIQAEGVFAFIKEDMGFRRFLTRGKANVTTEWTLLSMAYNVQKLHHRIQSGRLGTHLFQLKAA